MNKLWQWLQQPYPYEDTWHEYLRNGIVIGLFVAAFLYFFRPFGLGNINFTEYWVLRQCIYFGFATAVMTWLVGGISRIFPQFFNENDWVIWRELISNLLIVSLITMANIALGLYLYDNPFNLTVVILSFRNTLLIGLFPIVFAAYAKHQRWNNRYETAAVEASSHLKANTLQNQTAPLQLTGDNQQEKVGFFAHELLFIEAADNYAKLYLLRDDEVQSHLIRSTLKSLEGQLASQEQFFLQLHRLLEDRLQSMAFF